MVTLVGRKKKEGVRVSYNMSLPVRNAMLKAAGKERCNEIDMLEKLVKYGLAADNLLKSGVIPYSAFSVELDKVLEDSEPENQEVEPAIQNETESNP